MAVLRKPLLVIKVVIPYIALLALFIGFVIWNGSVVLGKLRCISASYPEDNIARR